MFKYLSDTDFTTWISLISITNAWNAKVNVQMCKIFDFTFQVKICCVLKLWRDIWSSCNGFQSNGHCFFQLKLSLYCDSRRDYNLLRQWKWLNNRKMGHSTTWLTLAKERPYKYAPGLLFQNPFFSVRGCPPPVDPLLHRRYCSAECRVSSGSEIRTWDLRFQGEDNTTTQKGLTRKCRRITSVTTFLPLLKRGDLCGVIPSTTVLWPVHNPVLFKQACIYTTEDTIVCDEICIHTNKLQHGFFLDILVANCSAECRVSSGSEIRTWDLRFQGEDDTTTQKGLTRKCGRITSVTTVSTSTSRSNYHWTHVSTVKLWNDASWHQWQFTCTVLLVMFTDLIVNRALVQRNSPKKIDPSTISREFEICGSLVAYVYGRYWYFCVLFSKYHKNWNFSFTVFYLSYHFFTFQWKLCSEITYFYKK